MTSPSDEWELDRRSVQLVIPNRERQIVLLGRSSLYRIPKGAVRATDCIAAGSTSAVAPRIVQSPTMRVEWNETPVSAGGCGGPVVPLGTYYGSLCYGGKMDVEWAGIKRYELPPGQDQLPVLAQELTGPPDVNLVAYTARCVTPNVWYHAGRVPWVSPAGPYQLLVDEVTGELSWWVRTRPWAEEFSRTPVCEGLKAVVGGWYEQTSVGGGTRIYLRNTSTLDWKTGEIVYAAAADYDRIDLRELPQNAGYTRIALHGAPTLGRYAINILYEQLLDHIIGHSPAWRDGFKYYWHSNGLYRIIRNPVDSSYETDITSTFEGALGNSRPNYTTCWTTQNYAFAILSYAPGGDDHTVWSTKRTVILARYPLQTVAQGTVLPLSDADKYVDLSDMLGWWAYWRSQASFLETQDGNNIWVFCPPTWSKYPSPGETSARPSNLLRFDEELNLLGSWKLPFNFKHPMTLWTI